MPFRAENWVSGKSWGVNVESSLFWGKKRDGTSDVIKPVFGCALPGYSSDREPVLCLDICQFCRCFMPKIDAFRLKFPLLFFTCFYRKLRGVFSQSDVMPNAMKTTVTIFTLLFLISISGRLFACSCIGQRTVEKELKHADAVVIGTVLSKQLITLIDSTIHKMFPNDTTMRNSPMSKMTIARYELLVQDIYKGKITNDTLTIYTGLGGGDCGIRFEMGQKYIVYGERKTDFGPNNDFKLPKAKNTFWTYICLRTSEYNQDEITEIEKYAKRKHIDNDEVIFADPDSPPTFKDGGDIGLKKFIQENLRYPKTGEFVTGKVYVGFTVDTLGNVKDIEIKKGITPSTDEEAIRVVKLFTFVPGTRLGQPIEMKMVLPISFK